MPRAATVCVHGGCPDDAIRDGRCSTHQRQSWRNPSASHTALQNGRWRRTRRIVLIRACWRCEIPGCRDPAVDVHHKIWVADGGSIYDLTNLQAVCAAHHKQQQR